MTDGEGRLVFLPAQGRGYSPHSTPLGSYATNPGWTDDVCDGSVRASVKLGKPARGRAGVGGLDPAQLRASDRDLD